jgi:integrase
VPKIEKSHRHTTKRATVATSASNGSKEKKMTRRRHQSGQLIETRHGWAMRYYVQGEGQRRRVQQFLGTFKAMTKPQAKHEMDKVLLEVNERPMGQPHTKTQTFAAAAEQWLAECAKRNRDPVKPSVIVTWQSILTNHLNPLIGELPLADIGNKTLKSVVTRLHHTRWPEKKLLPATIHNILMVAKLVVASPVDDDGNALFQRKWNSKFIDAPRVIPDKQNTPCFTADEVSQIVKTATGRVQMLCILLAASGLRIGEALGLECKHFDSTWLHVVQTIWGNQGEVQAPKTSAGDRPVDLHPDVASLLKQFIGNRKTGFVFRTSGGKPLTSSIALRRGLHPLLVELGIPQCGFHAFRRYRVTHLQQKGCGDMLLKIWLGHSAKGMTERYDKTKRDLVYRQDAVSSMGTGFDVPKTLTSKQKKTAQLGADAQLVCAEMPINVE